MNIVVLNVASSSRCYAPKARPTKKSLARAVITKPNEYFPVSLLFLRAVKGHLPRLEEAPPALHALPQVAPAAICSPFSDWKATDLRCVITLIGVDRLDRLH